MCFAWSRVWLAWRSRDALFEHLTVDCALTAQAEVEGSFS
jgi:hypothetical protein